MLRFILLALLCVSFSIAQEEREPSEFRFFRDKQQQEIEARILSISEDGQSIELEKTDGATYEIAVTVLSLDDQQFLLDWLSPNKGLTGKLRVFGVLPKGEEIDVSALENETGFQSIQAAKTGWIVLLPDGKLIDFAERFPDLGKIQSVASNTIWLAMTSEEGEFINGSGNAIHPEISTAVLCVAGSGHSAALLADGSVKVFGNRYDTDGVLDAPGELSGIVSLATTQSAAAALGENGSVHCWISGEAESVSFTPGDGAVEIHGNIYNFLALTRGGEVYQWGGIAVDKAKIPNALDPKETYIKVRANGSTYAAQREDRTWIAWGTNGAGIIDHINSLGPVEDIAFFSEPGKEKYGYVVWVEEEGAELETDGEG